MRTLFQDWVDLNDVIAPWRSRFDDLREMLNVCETRKEAEQALEEEGYADRYPKLPEYLS